MAGPGQSPGLTVSPTPSQRQAWVSSCKVIAAREGAKFKLASLERFAFYERANACYAVVATGERRLYGNIILKKGVVRLG